MIKIEAVVFVLCTISVIGTISSHCSTREVPAPSAPCHQVAFLAPEPGQPTDPCSKACGEGATACSHVLLGDGGVGGLCWKCAE